MPGRDDVVRGRTTFEWLEGGGYLIQRAVMDDPVFARGVMVIGPDADGERACSTPSTPAAWPRLRHQLRGRRPAAVARRTSS